MAKRKKSSKQVGMPPPKWYAVYNAGCVATGELREILLQDMERIKDGNKQVRGESYGVGPWHAVKVGRDCVTKQAPEGAVGPYLQPHIALQVAGYLNRIIPKGLSIQEGVVSGGELLKQLKMELA